jgi:hypothetical protein
VFESSVLATLNQGAVLLPADDVRVPKLQGDDSVKLLIEHFEHRAIRPSCDELQNLQAVRRHAFGAKPYAFAAELEISLFSHLDADY